MITTEDQTTTQNSEEIRLPWHRPRVERLEVNWGTAYDDLQDGSDPDALAEIRKPD